LLLGLVLSIAALAQVNPPAGSEGSAPRATQLPPGAGEFKATFDRQEIEGPLHKLRGAPGKPAEIEDSRMLFRADEIDYDDSTGLLHANGHVYFHQFEKNEQIWAARVDYDTDQEKGKFYEVRGEVRPKVVAKPGMLTSDNPFHFEGEWAERIGAMYVLHDGFVTNCKMPRPWWRLRGKTFEITPQEHAISRHSTFLLRRVPLFYTPFFYHSLEKEPRKSGFLLPTIGHSSQRGVMFHAGYFWAINRSYDVTYQVQAYPTRGFVHHGDFRGKPRPGTDYDAIVYGVQDFGKPDTGDPKNGVPEDKFSGISVVAAGKSDLGHGWTARANINYISSFRFRQEWSDSYNEAIGSEIHSVGFLHKDFSAYTLNVIFARLENFQSQEIAVTDPGSSTPRYLRNAVTIRKLPEAEFSGRDRQIFRHLPLYFSFDTAAGLLYRSQPVFDGNQQVDNFQTGEFMNRSRISPRVTGAFHFAGVNLVPSFAIDETYYGEAQSPYLDRYRVVGTNIVRSARDFSLDIVLPSLGRVFDKKTIFGDRLKHVIEPRVTYRYVTGIGEDYLRFIRFDENDILSNTNELLLGITNRIYAKRGNNVEEIFTWELFQKRYFDTTFGGALVPGTRNVVGSAADVAAFAFLVGPRSTSPVVSLLRMNPIGGLGVQWQSDYDHRRQAIVDSSLTVDYRLRKYFVSAGHNAVHTDPILTAPANQFRGRAGFGDANHKGVNAAVEAIYDYRKGVIQYTTMQVSYNTDCCGLSFQFHRFNVGTQDRNQFRVAFAVANIATTLGNLKKQDRMF
jgi:LPS-assembly protein